MKKKTVFNAFLTDWRRVKNHCRTTDNKGFTEVDPTDTFKKKLLISSQRDDRLIDDTPRGKKPQDALVNYDGFANMQNLIDAWRKRMCNAATTEARELAEDFKATLHETHPLESDVLVPNCIYRFGCPEFRMCQQRTFLEFLEWAEENHPGEGKLFNLQTRYDWYNEFFYEKRAKEDRECCN